MQTPNSELEILPAHARLRHREQVDVPQLGEEQQADDDDDDVDRAAEHGFVGGDESRHGRPGIRRCCRGRRDGPAKHHVHDGHEHHEQHAQDAGRPHDGRAQENVVDSGSDDRREEQYRDHRPQIGEPADDGIVRAIAADQAGNRGTHLPHRPQHDRQHQCRHCDQDKVERRRARTASRQYHATEIAKSPERGEQNGEPAQGARRSVGERQQPGGTVAARKQELGEEPGHPHHDDRDQQLQNGDTPQPVSLPEREEGRERGQREHGDPGKVEREPDAQAKRARGEGLRGRGHQPLAIVPQRPVVAALRQPADRQHQRQRDGQLHKPGHSAVRIVQFAADVGERLRQCDERVPEFAEPRAHHAGALLDPPRHRPVAPRPRRRGGTIELVDKELSHLLVGQARHELAHGFLGQRFRQRDRLRLVRLSPGFRGSHDAGRAGHCGEADGDRPANSIEHGHGLAP